MSKGYGGERRGVVWGSLEERRRGVEVHPWMSGVIGVCYRVVRGSSWGRHRVVGGIIEVWPRAKNKACTKY